VQTEVCVTVRDMSRDKERKHVDSRDKNVRRIAGLLAILLLVSLSSLDAQQKPGPIKLEDPELYLAFFRSHAAIDEVIQKGGAAAQQATSSNSSLYHVSADDFGKLTSEVRKFMGGLAAWQAKEQAYVTQQRVAKKLPDMKILVDFMHQRQRLVMNAHGSVHGALTSASWDGLHTYINGDFQASLSQKKGAAK